MRKFQESGDTRWTEFFNMRRGNGKWKKKKEKKRNTKVKS